MLQKTVDNHGAQRYNAFETRGSGIRWERALLPNNHLLFILQTGNETEK